MRADRDDATMRRMTNAAQTRVACHAPDGRKASPRAPRSWARRASWVVLALLAGCGTTEFEARPTIPEPLVTKIPLVVGVYVPAEFRDKVYKEKRDGGDYSIAIGKAQSEAFLRLMGALFERVVTVDAADAGARTDPQIRGVIEPVLEDVAFVTPVESGTDAYAVSLRYRINGYRPDGQVIDSWVFTGYGAAASESMLGGGTEVLKKALHLAMRDAAAKLATEFREQAMIRGLLPAESMPQAPVEVTPPPP